MIIKRNYIHYLMIASQKKLLTIAAYIAHANRKIDALDETMI